MAENLSSVAALANRLRVLQEQLADEPPSERSVFLAGEIKRALGTVDPRERKTFLEELLSRFPAWDALGAPPPPAVSQAPPVAPPADNRALADPDLLAERLSALGPKLSAAQREAIVRRLRDAGFALVETKGWPESLAREALGRYLPDGNEAIDPVRLARLAAQLLDFACTLDPFVWDKWRALVCKGKHKPPVTRPVAALKATVDRFLRGDLKQAEGQVAEDLKKLRAVIAAVVSAPVLGRGQHPFCLREEFSPEAIQEAVAGQGSFGLIPISAERKCWRRYVELVRNFDDEVARNKVVSAIADCALELLEPLSRGMEQGKGNGGNRTHTLA